jgi:hypothetical protein
VPHDHPTASDGIFTKVHAGILCQAGGLQKKSFVEIEPVVPGDAGRATDF